jgi:hypothetical protein
MVRSVQRVDRGQPGVAGGHAVAPAGLQVLQERADHRCVQVVEGELGGLASGLLQGEPQQQPDGVAVGGDGVVAGLTLADQPVGEEPLENGGERAHGRSPR